MSKMGLRILGIALVGAMLVAAYLGATVGVTHLMARIMEKSSARESAPKLEAQPPSTPEPELKPGELFPGFRRAPQE